MLLFLLVPEFGPMGAAVASLVGNLLAGLLNIWWLRRCFGIPARLFTGTRRSDNVLVRKMAAALKP